MRVPEFGVLRHDGTLIGLHCLAAERPVALVFLRHLGCIFCREQVATLRDALPDANIAFVTMAEPRLAARFRTWMRSPHPFYSDPDLRLYEAFGLQRGSIGQHLSLPLIRRGVQAVQKGVFQGRTVGDLWRLGGTFVMNEEGLVSSAFPAKDAGDYPSPEVLVRALSPTS